MSAAETDGAWVYPGETVVPAAAAGADPVIDRARRAFGQFLAPFRDQAAPELRTLDVRQNAALSLTIFTAGFTPVERPRLTATYGATPHQRRRCAPVRPLSWSIPRALWGARDLGCDYRATLADLYEQMLRRARDRRLEPTVYGIDTGVNASTSTTVEISISSERLFSAWHQLVTSLARGFVTPNQAWAAEWRTLYTPGFSMIEPGGRDAVEKKSLALLRDWLSPLQRDQFDKDRAFDVVGGATGKRYRIRFPALGGFNVDELDANGLTAERLCFVPRGSPAAGDIMLAQKISLEKDEDAALAVANRHSAALSLFAPVNNLLTSVTATAASPPASCAPTPRAR